MKSISALIKAIINTYAILFFSQNKALGGILLLVSFLNPVAGASALFCVLLSIGLTQTLGYHRETINAGIYSFNGLLLGLAFGTFYHVNLYYIIWLIFTCVIVVMLAAVKVVVAGVAGASKVCAVKPNNVASATLVKSS